MPSLRQIAEEAEKTGAIILFDESTFLLEWLLKNSTSDYLEYNLELYDNFIRRKNTFTTESAVDKIKNLPSILKDANKSSDNEQILNMLKNIIDYVQQNKFYKLHEKLSWHLRKPAGKILYSELEDAASGIEDGIGKPIHKAYVQLFLPAVYSSINRLAPAEITVNIPAIDNLFSSFIRGLHALEESKYRRISNIMREYSGPDSHPVKLFNFNTTYGDFGLCGTTAYEKPTQATHS